MNRRTGILIQAMTVAILLMAVASPALATFPGQNGRIAYTFLPHFVSNGISLTDVGQVTNGHDSYPAWSPDGSMIAFVDMTVSSTIVTSIEVCQKDGSGERPILTVTGSYQNPAVPLDPFSGFSYPVWSPDGGSITFVSSDGVVNRLYMINIDGTNLREIIGPEANPNGSLDVRPDQPTWSQQGVLAFMCDKNYRAAASNESICLFTPGGAGQLPFMTTLPFQPANEVDPFAADVESVSWMPDGQSLIFAASFHTGPVVEGHSEIFRINSDGTKLTQLTSSPVVCKVPKISYTSVAAAPDGTAMVAYGFQASPLQLPGSPGSCGASYGPYGYWILNIDGSSPTLLQLPSPVLTSNSLRPDWQPITQGLTFHILDGHNNPLKGMKVELRENNAGQDPIDSRPINTGGGTYVFQDGLVPGQGYIVRATLTDGCANPCTPAFEIHYAPEYDAMNDTPVWFNWLFTASPNQTSSYTLNFDANLEDNTDAQVIGYSVSSDAVDRLDDMADIYFRARQYVDWVKSNLTSDTGLTVRFYTFAISDANGNSIDPVNGAAPMGVHADVYYRFPDHIVISAAESDYSARDGVDDSDSGHNDDAPENVEWHEYTHHIYSKFVISPTSCDSSEINHAGYDNVDTCDSFLEGFAMFLPTVAAQDILGTASAMYAGSISLETNTKAWSTALGIASATSSGISLTETSAEDIAVASLLWDLNDANPDSEQSIIVGASGLPFVTTYTDQISIPISQLWAQLTSSKPKTVADLAFFLRTLLLGNPPLTIDLDGDGIPDVSPLDEVFLMHGFFPVDDEDTTPASVSQAEHYEVGYFSKSAPPEPGRDGWVGYSAHHHYDSSGALISTFHPRPNIPLTPTANLQVHILDSAGAPITSGATVNLTISYPEYTEIVSRPVSGDGALVHLELPAYFDYYLPAGAPLPACDPAHDLHVSVAVSVQAGGQNSTQTSSFDNCAYMHAIATATGPAALSFTFTVPIISAGDNIPPITNIALSPAPNGAGWNNTDVTATLTTTDNTGGSGVNQITYSASGAQTIATTSATGATATVGLSTEGLTTVTFFATDNAGNSEAPNQAVVSIDKTAPAGRCGSADGQWHATDVSIACTASDGLSGLSNPSDSSFLLTTAVPAGTETANASTGSHTVCDVAGNCTTAGPIGGNMVDEKPPTIVVTAPASGAYGLNQAVAANYNCGDGGSGVASCAGPVASGAAINTASVGNYTFTVNSADSVGNISAPQVISYSVTYNVCILYDPTRSVQSGATIPLKLDLCNADNADVSSPSVMVRATSLTQLSSNASLVIQDSGNANPDNDFRYDSTLGLTGGYIFNLSTKGLATGSYALSFTAGTDPATHTIIFQVR